jgi:glycosyltransferase involved in cell wall biosynthesis
MARVSPTPRRVLALEPWYGGSHRAFLDGWRDRSRHALEVLGLPDRHWKWRMRSSAWELARRLADRPPPEALVVSDYVDLPGLLGFLPAAWSGVPTVAYFHENQLTYPTDGPPAERDHGYGFGNILTCLRADRLVFNSRYHLEAFGAAAAELLARLPRPNPAAELERALTSAEVVAPGVDLDAVPPGGGGSGPLRVLFAHRWEHDKDPASFLDAVLSAREQGARLELVLLGERGARLPEGVAERLERLAEVTTHSGHLPSRADFVAALGGCDLAVSTARHEFFGVGVVEAMAAGVHPLLPARLSYPEVVGEDLAPRVLYSEPAELVRALVHHAADPAPLRDPARRAALRERAATWSLDTTARRLDDLIDALPEAAR